jgi:hypothetical protein
MNSTAEMAASELGDEVGDMPPQGAGNPDEGVIDMTESFDGMPVDISSPHRNYGEHRQELM